MSDYEPHVKTHHCRLHLFDDRMMFVRYSDDPHAVVFSRAHLYGQPHGFVRVVAEDGMCYNVMSHLIVRVQ